MLRFELRGIEPVSQGSMQFYGHGRVAHGRPAHDRALRAWRTALEAEARRALGSREPLSGPVAVAATFWRERPKAHYRGRSRAHDLASDAPTRPSTRPDLDKFARALIDAFEPAGLLHTDAQVAFLAAEERFADDPAAVGVEVVAWRLPDRDGRRLVEAVVEAHAPAGPAPGRLYVQASGPGGASP